MKFLSTFKAERSIAKLLEEQNIDSPDARKAAETLKTIGPGALPKVIDALAVADKQQSTVLVEALSSQLNDKTFPIIAEGLQHSNPRCVQGVAWAMSSTRTNRNYIHRPLPAAISANILFSQGSLTPLRCCWLKRC